MAVKGEPVTIRIGRLVVEGGSAADAAVTAAALRAELARLVAAGGLPASLASAATLDAGQSQAATPAHRGRDAAARVLGALK